MRRSAVGGSRARRLLVSPNPAFNRTRRSELFLLGAKLAAGRLTRALGPDIGVSRPSARRSPPVKPFTTIAVFVFSLVALLQLLRILLGWEVVVNGTVIPSWASGVAFVVAATLAVMLWREARG